MKLILNAFSLYFVIGHSVFDIGYSILKLIAMGFTSASPVSAKIFFICMLLSNLMLSNIRSRLQPL